MTAQRVLTNTLEDYWYTYSNRVSQLTIRNEKNPSTLSEAARRFDDKIIHSYLTRAAKRSLYKAPENTSKPSKKRRENLRIYDKDFVS